MRVNSGAGWRGCGLAGVEGLEGPATLPLKLERRVWLKKNDLGRGNRCGIKGKRFFRKMEAWGFEKCEELEQQLQGSLRGINETMKAMPVLMRPEGVWSA